MSATIAVKPLVWRRASQSSRVWLANQDGCHLFSIERVGGDGAYLLDFYPRKASLGRSSHLTIEEAQSAAQTEWDAFIRAAIQS